jgi:hypothetical protein
MASGRDCGRGAEGEGAPAAYVGSMYVFHPHRSSGADHRQGRIGLDQ